MDNQHQATSAALLATAAIYLQVFSTLDPSVISPIQSEGYMQEWAPASVNPPPAKDRQAFADHITHLKDLMYSFPVHAKQTWPNPSLKQVTIWAESETQFHDHVKDSEDEEEWNYKGEYIFVLTVDDDGKIEHVLEFVDSKGTERLRGLMARARRQLRQPGHVF